MLERILENGATISMSAASLLSRSTIFFALTTPVARAHGDRNSDLRDRFHNPTHAALAR
jgi:hypothetical protein